MFIFLIKLLSHLFASFKVYCMLWNSHCLNTKCSHFDVYTEISVFFMEICFKVMEKSWKSIGQNMLEPCTNYTFLVQLIVRTAFNIICSEAGSEMHLGTHSGLPSLSFFLWFFPVFCKSEKQILFVRIYSRWFNQWSLRLRQSALIVRRPVTDSREPGTPETPPTSTQLSLLLGHNKHFRVPLYFTSPGSPWELFDSPSTV